MTWGLIKHLVVTRFWEKGQRRERLGVWQEPKMSQPMGSHGRATCPMAPCPQDTEWQIPLSGFDISYQSTTENKLYLKRKCWLSLYALSLPEYFLRENVTLNWLWLLVNQALQKLWRMSRLGRPLGTFPKVSKWVTCRDSRKWRWQGKQLNYAVWKEQNRTDLWARWIGTTRAYPDCPKLSVPTQVVAESPCYLMYSVCGE